MAGYLGAIPVPQATQHRESFTATSGQTTFNTAGYTVGFLDVYLNGSHLSPADFTATNGSDVVLASGASTGDVCDIISYTAFEVADQTFTGTTTMDVAAITGVLTTTAATVFNGGFASNDGSTISTADNTTQLTLISTDADAAVGPVLDLYRNSSSPADSDVVGRINFKGENSAGESIDYAYLTGIILDVTDGTEDGYIAIRSMLAGSDIPRITMDGTETVINDASVDLDFRVESNGNANMLFVDGGNDRVGIGTVTPETLLEIASGNAGGDAGLDAPVLRITNTTPSGDWDSGDVNGKIEFYSDDLSGNAPYDTAFIQSEGDDNNGTLPSGALTFGTATYNVVGGAVERMRLDSSGNLLVGKASSTGATVGGEIRATGLGLFTASGTNSLQVRRLSNDGDLVEFYKDTGKVGSISVSGSSTAYNTSSDYRLKTDAQPMTNASARVQALNPVNFEWISDGTRVDGFLAHEAQEVVPEAVTGTKDAMMDEEYQVSAATGDIYTPATDAYVDADGNDVDAVEEVIHSADVEQPETLEDGKQWRETTAAVMGTRSVPDMQGIDQSKMVPLLVAALQEALARITALENA